MDSKDTEVVRNHAYNMTVDINDNNYIELDNIINDLLNGLRRLWLLILVVVSLMATIGFYRVKRSYVPVYQCYATFIVDVNTAVSYDSGTYYNMTMEQISKTFPYIISSNALRVLIAEDLGLSYVSGEIRAETLSDTSLVTIYVNSYTPEMSYKILQSVLKNYPSVAKSVIGSTQMKIIEESDVPEIPINPDTSKKMAAVFSLVALAASIMLILAYSLLKKTVRKEEDFQNMFNIRCLGSVPLVQLRGGRLRKKTKIIINERQTGYRFQESIRSLRTKIEADQADTNSKIYLITSTFPEEGKSTIAINISLALAEIGKKTVLVDMDVRNSSVFKLLGLGTPERGLSDLLENNCSIDDVLYKYGDGNLLILPQGKHTHRVMKTLSDKGLNGVFHELREFADFIILDTAPSGLLSDASIVARYADAGIYIVCQDFVPIDRIKDGIEMLTESGLRIAGCVLNQSINGMIRYGSGYGYSGRRSSYYEQTE